MRDGIRNSARTLWCACLLAGAPFVFGSNFDQSLSVSIEAAVLRDPEVIARKSHYDLLVRDGWVDRPASMPELRVKVEKEKLSDDRGIEAGLRWKLDPGNPKWLREKAYENEVSMAECSLLIAMAECRVRLKRSCVQLSLLKESLDLALSELRMQEELLEESEALLAADSTDRLLHFRAKLDYAKAREEVEALRVEIVDEEGRLSALGLAGSVSLGGERWRVAELASLDELAATHPQSRILLANRLFEAERALAKRKVANRSHLSYVQLQAEQEDGWNRDERDSRLGISFGVELPWGKRKRLKALQVDEKEEVANYEKALVRERMELSDTYEEYRTIMKRSERVLPVIDELLRELRVLSNSLASESSSSARNRLIGLEQERSRLVKERNELRYETLEAALELESRSCREIVLY